MDGNNRWSSKNNKNKFYSYKKGAIKLIELSKYIFENYKTNYISAFALSIHNLKRSKSFHNTFAKVLENMLDEINEHNFDFKIKLIGSLDFLKKNILKKINDLELLNTKSSKTLLVFINYSGKLEINNAIKKTKSGEDFKNNMLTYSIPDPDILIRTGGFKRLSDFMLYQLSFTELFFSKKLWPDLKKSDIQKIIDNFKSIERKFGI